MMAYGHVKSAALSPVSTVKCTASVVFPVELTSKSNLKDAPYLTVQDERVVKWRKGDERHTVPSDDLLVLNATIIY